VPDGYTVNMHPVAFAAWFGMLATTLNLFPIGQTDGGHVSYAVFGRYSTLLSFGTLGGLVALSFMSMSWIVWTVLMAAMLVLIGPSHPRTIDEHIPLDRARVWLAVFALAMFILCFSPVPAELVDLVAR
jgi:membrane-associated protease RseP (regulator of RpoE activity)